MQILAQLKKSLAAGGFAKKENHSLKNVGGQVAAPLTARYYKGISSDGDNVILLYDKRDSNNRKA